MNDFVIPFEGELSILRAVLAQPCTLRLFANDVTPREGATAEDFVEFEGGGYLPKPVRAGMWSVDAERVGHLAEQRWVFDGPAGIVYGWYVTCDVDGTLRFASRLRNGPQQIFSRGDNLGVDVSFSLPPATESTP
jgi:hypothetical protein